MNKLYDSLGNELYKNDKVLITDGTWKKICFVNLDKHYGLCVSSEWNANFKKNSSYTVYKLHQDLKEIEKRIIEITKEKEGLKDTVEKTHSRISVLDNKILELEKYKQLKKGG